MKTVLVMPAIIPQHSIMTAMNGRTMKTIALLERMPVKIVLAGI